MCVYIYIYREREREEMGQGGGSEIWYGWEQQPHAEEDVLCF